MVATDTLRARLLSGLVIPAHPLALNASRQLDERRQRALTRYYRDAGAGGVAAVLRDLSGCDDEVGVAREAGTKCPQVLEGTH